MTNRENYFKLIKQNDKYLTKTVIKSLLFEVNGFNNFIDLVNNFDKETKDENLLNKYVLKIKEGVPYQYVLGHAHFVDDEYYVNENVLIPRQETEQLAVGAYYYIQKVFKDNPITICDIGTGSGILAIYLKKKFENSRVIAIDVDNNCLDVAKQNATNHQKEIIFIQGDWIKPLIEQNIKCDVIVSNPPYIKDESTVAPETLKYEPHLALFATPQTKFYEEIIKNYQKITKEHFFIAFEIEENMQEELTKLIEEYMKDALYRFEKDLYGKQRFLYIMK